MRFAMSSGAETPPAADDANNADAAEPDAEVSFVTKDLGPVLPKAKIAAVVAIDENTQVVEVVLTGIHHGFPDRTLLQFAVAS